MATRFLNLGLCACFVIGSTVSAEAHELRETMDEKIKRQLAAGDIEVKVQEHTRDACDRRNNVTITSTTDGDVVLKPGEEKYFKINKDQDDYTRSGGWYWKCGNTGEKARIKGSSTIKAVRKENGVIDWYWVLIELK